MEGHAANAQFFFFDNNGVYMAQANYHPIGGKPNTENPDGNIEFTGDAVVVLENIKSKDAPTYPNYMITLVNCNGEFSDEMLKGKTMQWFSERISTWGEGDAAKGRFRMSSTSYFNGDAGWTDHNDAYYYATALSSDNFARTPELALAKTKPVKVFVERLAARGSLKCDSSVFEVKATVAGMENGVVGVPEAATKLFVRIDGWGLNGTCPKSYISKQLTGWNADKTFETKWEFNAPGNRRSYWGQSTLYDTKYDEATFATNLNFFPASKLMNDVTTVLYCNENTNSKEALKLENGLPNQRLLTSATITATVGTKDAAGNFVPVDLVEHNGVYFKKDAFVAYVLGILDNNKKLRYYTLTQATETTEEGVLTDKDGNAYKQVDASMFDIKGDNDSVYVVKGEKFPTVQLYTYTINANDEREWTETDAKDLAKDLKNATKDVKTIGFKGGMMTYNIPIAHENTKTYDETTKDLTEWYEASFGVVRNHAYQIKVNSIKRLGNGVFDPDKDPIIPDEDPKDPNWYMGAEINILSWKIVNNSVDL